MSRPINVLARRRRPRPARPAHPAPRAPWGLWALACTLAACAAPATVVRPSPAAVAGDTATVVIAATTDVHGRLRGWDYFADRADAERGLSRAATVVDSVRAANPGRVLLLDAGDLLQGNPLTYVAARVSRDTLSPVVAAMNAMQYDAAAIGNHEFNYGVPLLDRAVAQARFPFLSANSYRPDGARKYRAWHLVERGGVKVGLVGATTPGVMVWDRDNVRGRVEVRDIVPALREAVDEARAAGAEVVVATVHSGLDGPSSYDTVTTGVPSENVSGRIAREIPGIDVVVFGHSHREVADTVIGSTLLVQPKNWATSVAVATLRLARDGGRWRVTGRRGAIVPAAGHAEHPGVLAATERMHRETVAYVTAPIGSTPVAWRADSARAVDTPLIDFMLEVQRRTAGADLASTAAFSLEATLDSGAITVAEIARLYPYENTLRAVRISGRQLREYLEHSARYYRTLGSPGTAASLADPAVPGYNFDIVAGADYTIDLSRPLGQRITRLAVRGRPVTPADSFTLALNNYRQTGGGGYAMLSGAPVVHDKGEEIRQLLIDEVRRRRTIRPADYHTVNWRIEPAAAVSAALAVAPERGGGPRAQRGGAAAPTAPFLRIISTNDFHGALEGRADARGVRRGGAAAVAAAVRQAQRECAPLCATILLDGGDMFQGTPASNLAYGRPVTELYDSLGYAAAALGNHEFDWGQDTLRARMRGARYAILGANVRDTAGRDVPWVRDDTLVTRGPFRVGIVGVSTVETARVTRSSNVVGLRFVDPAPIVDERARALRARGADFVVVVAHAGAFCNGAPGGPPTSCDGEIVDLARRLREPVDAIVSGHTHSLVDVVVRDVPIVQARSSGRAIAVLDVSPRSARTGVIPASACAPARGATCSRAEVRDVLSDSTRGADDIAALVQASLQRVAPIVSREVGTVAEAMPRVAGAEYALGNLIADSQRAATRADIAVMNNGGIRADLRAGPVNYGSLFEILPFDNVLYRVTAPGAAVRAYLERLVEKGPPDMHASGVRVTYDLGRPAGQRITSAEVGGAPLRDDRTYTVAMNSFMATGDYGLPLTERASSSEPTGVSDLDALVRYVTSLRGPIRPPADARFVRAGR